MASADHDQRRWEPRSRGCYTPVSAITAPVPRPCHILPMPSPLSPLRALVVSCMVAALALACGGGGKGNSSDNTITGPGGDRSFLASCGSNTQLFSVIPLDRTKITGWVPLGNLNPPAHNFPTDHQYIYLTPSGTTTPLLAPGEVTVTVAKITDYHGAQANDYDITFNSCREVMGEFGHVRSLSASLLSQLGAFDQGCNTYSPTPTQTVTQCYTKPARIVLHAGDVMGTSAGLDLWLYDSRITPIVYANASRFQTSSDGLDRFHIAPFSDYYAEPARSQVRALLGQYDGAVKRTVEPLGGTLSLDIAGTAQGNWFNASQPTFPESPHLAIVPDNVDPTMVDLSIGTSQPGFSASVYRMFPSTSGNANKHPAQITPGPTVYCYDVRHYFGFGIFARMLLQLGDATTLTVEMQTGGGDCASAAPWSFTAGQSVSYRR